MMFTPRLISSAGTSSPMPTSAQSEPKQPDTPRPKGKQAQLKSDIVCHQLANFELHSTLETLGMNALLEYKLDETEENREEDPRVPRRTLKHIDKYKIQMAEVLDAALYHTFLDISSTCVFDITCISRFRNLEVLIMYYLSILKGDVTKTLMEQIGSGYNNVNLAMEDEFFTNRHGRACICMH
ncbi:unnamed protein product [Caenorhabditis sp. 36 PRJEB53466]|nr:unnamed protein product [Caenorhabditis sp. 36 PRJEB53466]